MTGTKTVIDQSRIGTKGYPRHPSLYGTSYPTKEVPVEGPDDPGTAPTLPPTLTDYSRAIDTMLDARAQERQYDSIRTAVTYRDDPNPQFAAEGQALFAWRSTVWTYATAELAKVQAGEREQPSVADFIAEMAARCPFSWPAA